MKKDTWNPDQYHRYRGYRRRPFEDLLAGVAPVLDGRVIDLGCGSGELTAVVHETVGAAYTLGVDSSEAMIAAAASHARGGAIEFLRSDIQALIDDESQHGTWDLIFSNAALHWLPHHASLLPRLACLLKPGGQLAVQMPANHTEDSHTAAVAVASQEPFVEALKGWTMQSPVRTPIEYSRRLFEIGCAEPRVQLAIYPQALDSREDIIEWVKGALLTSYQRRLPDDLWPRFLDAYRDALFDRVPDVRPCYFPYRRILMWAYSSTTTAVP